MYLTHTRECSVYRGSYIQVSGMYLTHTRECSVYRGSYIQVSGMYLTYTRECSVYRGSYVATGVEERRHVFILYSTSSFHRIQIGAAHS